MGQQLLTRDYSQHVYTGPPNDPAHNHNFPGTLHIPDNEATNPGSTFSSAPVHPTSFQVASGTLINPGDIPTFVAYATGALAGFNYIGLGENQSYVGDGVAMGWLPEPGTLALTAFAGAALVLRRLKRSQRSRER